MMKYLALTIGLLLSLNVSAKMSECDIAKEAFRDSYSLMNDIFLFGMDSDDNPREYNYYHTWYKNYYPNKLEGLKDKYGSLANKIDSNNPIYLGTTSIAQVNGIASAMDLYLKDNSNKSRLKEEYLLYGSMYQKLVKNCGEIFSYVDN